MIIHAQFGFHQISNYFSIWSYIKTLSCCSGHLGLLIQY